MDWHRASEQWALSIWDDLHSLGNSFAAVYAFVDDFVLGDEFKRIIRFRCALWILDAIENPPTVSNVQFSLILLTFSLQCQHRCFCLSLYRSFFDSLFYIFALKISVSIFCCLSNTNNLFCLVVAFFLLLSFCCRSRWVCLQNSFFPNIDWMVNGLFFVLLEKGFGSLVDAVNFIFKNPVEMPSSDTIVLSAREKWNFFLAHQIDFYNTV